MTAGLRPGLHEGAARPELRQLFVGGPGRRAGDQTRRVPEADTSPCLRRRRGLSGPMLPNPAPPRRGARKAEKSARRAAPSPPGALPRRHAIIARRASTTRLPGSRHIAVDACRPQAPGTGQGGGCRCIGGSGVGACRRTGVFSTAAHVNSWSMVAWAGARLGTRLRRSGRSRRGGDSTRSGRYRPTPAVARLAGPPSRHPTPDGRFCAARRRLSASTAIMVTQRIRVTGSAAAFRIGGNRAGREPGARTARLPTDADDRPCSVAPNARSTLGHADATSPAPATCRRMAGRTRTSGRTAEPAHAIPSAPGRPPLP